LWSMTLPGVGSIHNEIESALLEENRHYNFTSIAFDPWNAAQLSVALMDHGMPLYEFVQGLRSYNAPTKELDAMLAEQKLDHGDNPVLKWMALNMRVQTDKNNNEMPTKKHSVGRIDGAAALVMAIGRSMSEEESPYADGRPMLILH
jgi:phage terminase large subunit-like protein